MRMRLSQRRGAAAFGAIIVLVILQLVIVCMVVAGARDQDMSVQRADAAQAFYAGEAGVNMSMREVRMGTDADGDGSIGGVSSDGDAANDPAIGSGRVSCSAVITNGQATMTSLSRSGAARRKLVTDRWVAGMAGYPTPYPNYSMENLRGLQCATKFTMPIDGTVTGIAAYTWGAPGHSLRLAIYTDQAGEPRTLVAQSPVLSEQSSQEDWLTNPMPPTSLTAGTYWLAVAFDHNDMSYMYAPMGETRHMDGNNAVDNGFTVTWNAATTTRFTRQFTAYISFVPGGGSGTAPATWVEVAPQ